MKRLRGHHNITMVKDTLDAVHTNESEIAVHWKEEEYYAPSPDFVKQANLTDPSVNDRFAEKNFPQCFEEYADMLTWYERWNTVLDTQDPPFWKWFVGGKINASYNCVDRNLALYRNKAAIVFVPEPEDEEPQVLTYQELYVRVNEFAALLRNFCITTLANPDVVEQIRITVQGKEKLAFREGPEDLKQFGTQE